MRCNRFWRAVALTTGVATLVAACTSGDDTSTKTTGSTTTSAGETTTAPTGPSPGVTDDTIKIGITYTDAAALQAIGLDYEFGDLEGAYQALIDDINDAGGIHGRKLEAVFAPIDPTSPTPAEEKCVELTEDEDVFMVVGFFLTDAVLCPVALHETAVQGGEMNPERLEQAKAPWITWTPDSDLPEAALRAYDDLGELDGKVAVFVNARDKAVLDNQVTPVLEDLGVEPVESGVVDAPPTDQAAIKANVKTIAERFKAADADTVVLVGLSGTDWPTNMADDASYRPKLLFLDVQAAPAFHLSAATTDRSILDGSFATGVYGPAQASNRWIRGLSRQASSGPRLWPRIGSPSVTSRVRCGPPRGTAPPRGPSGALAADGRMSKACCARGSSAYTTSWFDTLRSSSTNVRACSTGTSESLTPWSTNIGGASGPMWNTGDAASHSCGRRPPAS